MTAIAKTLLTAAARSGNPGALELAAQLSDAWPCKVCDFVNYKCQCGKGTSMSEYKLPEPDGYAAIVDGRTIFTATQIQTAYQAGLAARVPEYDKNELNAAVTELYDAKMREGKHGHYETLFHCVHAAIRRVYAAPEAP
jgi:hypothetical protein